MSTLRNRVVYQDQANNDFSNLHLTAHPEAIRQANTLGPAPRPAPPMTMPFAIVTYDLDGQVTYADMHPYINTGDVNAAPVPATDNGRWDQVAATGRP